MCKRKKTESAGCHRTGDNRRTEQASCKVSTGSCGNAERNVWNLCHRNASQNLAEKKGYPYRKTKAVPAKANEKEQKHFVNCVLSDLLKDAKNGLKKVYFADGVHLIYGYEKGYCQSQQPVSIPSGYGRKRVNIPGFLDAVTHQVLKVMNKEENYLNTDSVCRGLKMIREQNPEAKQIYIILDNASYQHCKKVMETAVHYGIVLVFLPPYSPNLNLQQFQYRQS